MKLVLTVLVSLALAAGCSDDAAKDDSAVGDLGRDGPVKDAAVTETSLADGAGVDASSGSPGCKQLGQYCAASKWKEAFSPVTAAKCDAVMSCMNKLYTGACLTKVTKLMACVAKIAASSECDTLCAAEMKDIMSTCQCPASCGVLGCGGSDGGAPGGG